MKRNSQIRLIAAVLIVGLIPFVSCKKSFRVKPDVSKIASNVVIVPFYKQFNALGGSEDIQSKLDSFKQAYPLYFKDFSQSVLGVKSNSAELPLYASKFIDFEANKMVYETCVQKYSDLSALKKSFDEGAKYYKYYFPNQSLDTVFLQMSGFSTFMLVDSGFVAVSLERYLGVDCSFYNYLGDPQYLRRKMVPEKLVPDAFKAIAYVDYPNSDSTENLLSNMIYQGKVLHFVARMVPEIEDSLLFDYTQKEMDWAKSHEEQAWSVLVEKKHLYSTEHLLIQKYVGDGPFTPYFGQESPARMACYIGYRIVDEYLKRNSTVTLEQLMLENDAQMILRKSRYNP